MARAPILRFLWRGQFRVYLNATLTLVNRLNALQARLPLEGPQFIDSTVWAEGTTVPIALATIQDWASTRLRTQSTELPVFVIPPMSRRVTVHPMEAAKLPFPAINPSQVKTAENETKTVTIAT